MKIPFVVFVFEPSFNYLLVDYRIASSSNKTSMENKNTEANDDISKPNSLKIKDLKEENSHNNLVSRQKPKTKLSKDG